jgi:hypothetical protein
MGLRQIKYIIGVARSANIKSSSTQALNELSDNFVELVTNDQEELSASIEIEYIQTELKSSEKLDK